MSRAYIETTKGLIYEYLDVTGATFGTYQPNPRYVEEHITQEIYSSDTFIAKVIAKRSQDVFLSELQKTQEIGVSGSFIPFNTNLISIQIFNGTSALAGIEVDYSDYEAFSQGGIFGNYLGYYSIKNGRLYFIGTRAVVTYLPASL